MINNRQIYHNHKEMMAWVITAFYIPSIIYLGSIFDGTWRDGFNWVAIVVIGLVLFFVLVFVKTQFDMRWQAADVTRVLMHRWAGLNGGAELPRQDEWKIDDIKKHDWPHFVQHEICRLRRENRKPGKALKALGKIFLYGPWDSDKVKPRWKTEISSYALIIIATVFAIFLAVCN